MLRPKSPFVSWLEKGRNTDYLIICGLLLLHTLIQTVYFRYLGRFIVDAGKELTAPWLLLDGRQLYRDIFWLYGPWAPNFNALLYRLFGIHTDVIMAFAKVLAAGLIVAVYACLKPVTNRHVAAWTSLSVLAFSTTSNYFAWPYSFSNLWATVMALFAVYGISLWQRDKKTFGWWLALISTIVVVLCKFIIALPLLVTFWGVVIAERLLAKWTNKPQPVGDIVPAVLFSVVVISVFAVSIWWYGQGVETQSYMLQRGAVFHARHLVEAGLYDRLREVIFLQNGFSPGNISAAIAVLLCLFGVMAGIVTWVHGYWLQTRRNEELLAALPLVLFAAGNLLQMNSSVHAPYVFPASAVSLAWAVHRWRQNRTWHTLAVWTGCSVVVFCLLLGVLRLVKVTEKTVDVQTARYHFAWVEEGAKELQDMSRYVDAHTQATDRAVIFARQDYLYMVLNRKPALGYFYTWYEPLHNRAKADTVIAALESPEVTLVISDADEPFSLGFLDNPREHPIYLKLKELFEPVVKPDVWGAYIVWIKKRPPIK